MRVAARHINHRMIYNPLGLAADFADFLRDQRANVDQLNQEYEYAHRAYTEESELAAKVQGILDRTSQDLSTALAAENQG